MFGKQAQGQRRLSAHAQVIGGRTVAVDWAVPKAQFTANGAEGAAGAGHHVLAAVRICIGTLDTKAWAWHAGEAAEGAAAAREAAEDPGSAEEEEEGSDEEEAAAGAVLAGDAAESLGKLEEERALLKSVLAELDAEDDEEPQTVRQGSSCALGKVLKSAWCLACMNDCFGSGCMHM